MHLNFWESGWFWLGVIALAAIVVLIRNYDWFFISWDFWPDEEWPDEGDV